MPRSPGWAAAIEVTPFFSLIFVLGPTVSWTPVWPASSLPWRLELLTSIVIEPFVCVDES
jgi:hypothetical protein